MSNSRYGASAATLTALRCPSPSPLPSSVPRVDELGVSSAPLKSASFFIGEFCKPYNGPSRRCDVVVRY